LFIALHAGACLRLRSPATDSGSTATIRHAGSSAGMSGGQKVFLPAVLIAATVFCLPAGR
jgi:hypothetical protein